MSAGENPYAAPAVADVSGIPDAPPSHGWWIEGDRLLVAEGAQLPMVDPFNGRSPERMTMREFRIDYRPAWTRFLLGGAFSAIVIGVALSMSDTLQLLAEVLWIAGPLLLAVLFFVGLRQGSVRLRAFCSDRTDGLIMISRGLGGVVAIGFVGMFFPAPLVQKSAWIPSVAAVLFLVALAARLLIRFSQRRLICRVRQEERFEIRGLHPDALEYLKGLPKIPPR